MTLPLSLVNLLEARVWLQMDTQPKVFRAGSRKPILPGSRQVFLSMNQPEWMGLLSGKALMGQ